ncbi:MAG: hypothetical protein KIT31_34385 [Deltaproteobacteria bacterium]|nr:hypothetical protein [Deltaproteobacteria bacterium]
MLGCQLGIVGRLQNGAGRRLLCQVRCRPAGRDQGRRQLRLLERGDRPRRGALQERAEDERRRERPPQARHPRPHAGAVERAVVEQPARAPEVGRDRPAHDPRARDHRREAQQQHEPQPQRQREDEGPELDEEQRPGRVLPGRQHALDRHEQRRAAGRHRDRAADVAAQGEAEARVARRRR